MNAAFLLVTTAWIAGADAAAPPTPTAPVHSAMPYVVRADIEMKEIQKPAPTPAAPVYSVGAGGCGGVGCGACDSCGCESEGFLSKLKGRFHHSDCGCEREGFLSKFKGHMHKSDCGCDTGCGGCGSPCDACEGGHHGGGKLREKLRGLFNRGHDDCCDTGCDCCGGGCGYGGVITPLPGTMPKVEQIAPPKNGEPKKLPSGDTNPEKKPSGNTNPEKKPGSVRLIPQPVDVPDLDVAPTSGKSPF